MDEAGDKEVRTVCVAACFNLYVLLKFTLHAPISHAPQMTDTQEEKVSVSHNASYLTTVSDAEFIHHRPMLKRER